MLWVEGTLFPPVLSPHPFSSGAFIQHLWLLAASSFKSCFLKLDDAPSHAALSRVVVSY